MRKNKYDSFEKYLRDLKNNGLFNNIKVIDSPMGPKIKTNGKWVLNLCSNNYLGLANDERLKKSAKQAIDKYGVGPAAVRSIAGTTSLHIELEKSLAKFKKVEDVITYQSGFNANIATIPALADANDTIFSDELNHASIIDGCRLSKAKIIRYKHADYKDLESKLKPLKGDHSKFKRFIITDGVFSMDGDIAPLDDIYKIARKHNCILIVDDAHGEGVLGKNGRGIVDHFGLHGKVDFEIGTLSKAFGAIGGFVAGKRLLIDWLRQRSRPFLFSSAMTAADVAASIESVKILSKSEKLVKKLWENTESFKAQILSLGFDIGKTQTPIVPIMIGDAKWARKFSSELFKEGVFAMAIGYPTVPIGKARIRVMISASHTTAHLGAALKAFEKVGKKLKII